VLVDLDWDKLRAVDIFAALRSFLPAGGAIKRVTVYPSDYGLERMAQEAAEGPTVRGFVSSAMTISANAIAITPSAVQQSLSLSHVFQGIYRSAAANGSEKPSAPETDGEELAAFGPEEDFEAAADDEQLDAEDVSGDDSGDDDDEDADEVDQEALRLYERSKLRWHYAVAECDSARTAAHLYAECDGMEFQLSACKFDLRFVPDAQVRPPTSALPLIIRFLQLMLL